MDKETSGDALLSFVNRSIRSFPPELAERLAVLLLTRPRCASEASGFWYAVKPGTKSNIGPRVAILEKSLARRKLAVEHAEISQSCAPVDLRPFLGDVTLRDAGEWLRHVQNAYNLRHTEITYPSSPPPPQPLRSFVTCGNWGDKNFHARQCFFEGEMLTAAPQQRLEWVLADGGAPSSLTELRETLRR
jgi:hypothetical protein